MDLYFFLKVVDCNEKEKCFHNCKKREGFSKVMNLLASVWSAENPTSCQIKNVCPLNVKFLKVKIFGPLHSSPWCSLVIIEPSQLGFS